MFKYMANCHYNMLLVKLVLKVYEWEVSDWKGSQAQSYTCIETHSEWPSDWLTGVKCRATSIAKKSDEWLLENVSDGRLKIERVVEWVEVLDGKSQTEDSSKKIQMADWRVRVRVGEWFEVERWFLMRDDFLQIADWGVSEWFAGSFRFRLSTP